MIDEEVALGGAGAAEEVRAAGDGMTRAEVDAQGGDVAPVCG